MSDAYGMRPYVVLFAVGLAAIPLALWKLVEIVAWMCSHVQIGWAP